VFAIGKSQQVTYMKQVDVPKMCNAMVPMDDPFSEFIVIKHHCNLQAHKHVKLLLNNPSLIPHLA
jgi:hypothetical protein